MPAQSRYLRALLSLHHAPFCASTLASTIDELAAPDTDVVIALASARCGLHRAMRLEFSEPLSKVQTHRSIGSLKVGWEILGSTSWLMALRIHCLSRCFGPGLQSPGLGHTVSGEPFWGFVFSQDVLGPLMAVKAHGLQHVHGRVAVVMVPIGQGCASGSGRGRSAGGPPPHQEPSNLEGRRGIRKSRPLTRIEQESGSHSNSIIRQMRGSRVTCWEDGGNLARAEPRTRTHT